MKTDVPLLKLRAEDAEDVAILAPLLQDAILKSSDMSLLPAENDKTGQQFVILFSRFCWEKECMQGEKNSPAPYARVHSSLIVNNVIKVKHSAFDRGDTDQVYNILTLSAEDSAITLLLAGGGKIKIQVEKISCWLQDLAEPWPTAFRPLHNIA